MTSICKGKKRNDGQLEGQMLAVVMAFLGLNCTRLGVEDAPNFFRSSLESILELYGIFAEFLEYF